MRLIRLVNTVPSLTINISLALVLTSIRQAIIRVLIHNTKDSPLLIYVLTIVFINRENTQIATLQDLDLFIGID